ncbi:hypothetical protein Ddc_06789 [Ditylenchus destructor]|nr:hypothetical protein Ddc_06789 [Ditylenchus destructor]
MLFFISIIGMTIHGTDGLVCHQCNGWHGRFPSRDRKPSTCDNLNNQCETTQFCVKIVDPVSSDAGYVTYKSDCFYQNNLEINSQNVTSITDEHCYTYRDGSTPPKKYYYCFCNDRDYCNNAPRNELTNLFIIIALPLITSLTMTKIT